MSNNLKEERMEILKMIEDGKISSKEGLELLNTLEEKSESFPTNKCKWLKIRVFDPDDKTKINVNVPIALVDIGLKFATKMSPELKDSSLESINFTEIAEAIKNGAQGKIVDIESENGEKVEIIVE